MSRAGLKARLFLTAERITMLSIFGNTQGHLGEIQDNDKYAKAIRAQWYDYYYNYFFNMLVNLYKWDNLPESFDERYMETVLINNGILGVFEHPEIGIMHLSGNFSNEVDMYGYNKRFMPISMSNPKPADITQEKTLLWHKSDFYDDIYKRAVVIPNNNQFSPSNHIIAMFAQKLADIEATMHQNRVAQVTPYIVVANNRNVLSLKNIVSKIFSFEPVVYVNQNKKSELMEKSLDEKIKVLNLQAPYLLDKLQDDKQHVINQFLTYVGINNSPVDKKERLVSAEVESNNDQLLSNMMVGLKARQNAADLINHFYGTDIKVSLYTQAFEQMKEGDEFDPSKQDSDNSQFFEE